MVRLGRSTGCKYVDIGVSLYVLHEDGVMNEFSSSERSGMVGVAGRGDCGETYFGEYSIEGETSRRSTSLLLLHSLSHSLSHSL